MLQRAESMSPAKGLTCLVPGRAGLGVVDTDVASHKALTVKLNELINSFGGGEVNETAALEVAGFPIGKPPDPGDLTAVLGEIGHLIIIDIEGKVTAEAGNAALGLNRHLLLAERLPRGPWLISTGPGLGEVNLDGAAHKVLAVLLAGKDGLLSVGEGNETASLEFTAVAVGKPVDIGGLAGLLEELLDLIIIDVEGKVSRKPWGWGYPRGCWCRSWPSSP